LLIALNNLKLNYPCFVSIGYSNSGVYIGRWSKDDEFTIFKSEEFNEIPNPLLNQLSGILDLFSLSIGTQIEKSFLISSRFTFIKNGFNKKEWVKIIDSPENLKRNLFYTWGSLKDPIDQILISCSWDLFNENSIKCKLDPESADKYFVKCNLDLE
jgi:hypothetical protein